MVTQMHETIKVGSWIRFYNGGVLVIGVVEYLEKDSSGYWIAKTNIGPVDTRYVLEARNDK
jgi:hypothetical protein